MEVLRAFGGKRGLRTLGDLSERLVRRRTAGGLRRDRRQVVHVTLRRSQANVRALCAIVLIAAAHAQMREHKGPVEITVGSGPGGTPDVIMRNIVKIMTEEKIVTIPVVVQNRVGGSHSNAYNYVL